MFGLQRTCTNVVLKGIKKNFRMISRERGREWKHGRVRKSADDIPILVFCFREPFAWLSSMYRWSFSGDRHGCPHFCKAWSFTDFLARRHYDWPTPVDRWNDLNRHYLNWVQDHPERGIVVRSEDMMSPEDARKQYLRIGKKFGLNRKSCCLSRWIFPTSRSDCISTSIPAKFGTFSRNGLIPGCRANWVTPGPSSAPQNVEGG